MIKTYPSGFFKLLVDYGGGGIFALISDSLQLLCPLKAISGGCGKQS